jgi:hypothetical protein
MQWFPKSALRTTGGPRDELKWSTNLYANQYFMLRGALKYIIKLSALQKSLWTTDVLLELSIPECLYLNGTDIKDVSCFI